MMPARSRFSDRTILRKAMQVAAPWLQGARS